jgi:hypothetical protein
LVDAERKHAWLGAGCDHVGSFDVIGNTKTLQFMLAFSDVVEQNSLGSRILCLAKEFDILNDMSMNLVSLLGTRRLILATAGRSVTSSTGCVWTTSYGHEFSHCIVC